MKTKTFNDFLALVFALGIIALWILDPVLRRYVGFGLPDQVVGATIGLLIMVGQFYFRKAQGEPNSAG